LEDFYEKICGTPESSSVGLVFFFFILRALLFLESIGCAHRDIKPDNFVVIDDDSLGTKVNIKLIDFGTVKEMKKTVFNTKLSSVIGTLPYMAPEAFKGVVSTKLDVWSLGIMLYRLIYNNEYPSYVQDERSIMMFAASDDEVEFPRCKPEFSDLLQLAKLCLIKDYNKRMFASDLYKYTYSKYNDVCKQIIKDPYINNPNVATLRNDYNQINKKQNAPKKNNFASHQNKDTLDLIQATKNLSLGDKKCFICNESLPRGHKYNRCDKCFDSRCLICYKVLPRNYQHRRCEECFKSKCLDCHADLPKGHPYRRCNSCFAKSRR
jgi:serine/threonine protein kinase